MEKQRDKQARRIQRKVEKATGPPVDDMGEPVGDLSLPSDDEVNEGADVNEVNEQAGV